MALEAPRNSLTVGHCGNPGGLRHRLNPSSRGPRNDDRSGERSINFALRETEIFRPSKAGAIVGSVHRGPCADKQRVMGRTAPPVFFLPGRDFERDRKDELRPATLRVITWSAEPYPLLHSRSGDRRPPLPLLAE